MDRVMSESMARPVWETLPAERQRSIALLVGQMAMRHVRRALAGRERAAEENADDRRESRAAARRGPAREGLSGAP